MKQVKPIAVIALTFVSIQILAIAFMYYALDQADQVFQNPDDPLIAVYYLLMLLGFTGLFLVLIKFGLDKAIKGIFYVSIGFVIFFVGSSFFSLPFNGNASISESDTAIVLVASISLAVLSVLAIWKRPEWYVIDTVGVAMSVGMIALLGLSLSIVPILILLIALAVYDFLSVYKTKHMLTLAEGVSDMGLPLLLVVPKKLPYSYMENKPKLTAATEKPEEKPEREAFLVGLGDIIIPGLLSASAFWFINDGGQIFVFGIPSYLMVALGTIAGSLVGLILLMRIVMKGNPQAGLPLLNTGALLGFFITYILVFGFNFSYIT
jgi:presenilin-like A22 family membrane protease